MNFFIDFDHTLYNTPLLTEDMLKALASYISKESNKDYNNKNLRILKKVVEENIHPKNKVLISASQYVNVKNGYKKNIKACIFYQSYSIQLYEKDLFFDDKITTGKVKIPIGIVFIVSKDMKSNK